MAEVSKHINLGPNNGDGTIMDNPRIPIKPTDDNNSAAAIAGRVFAICFCAALIMLTIKLGMVLFG